MRHLRAWWRELCLATSENYVVTSKTSFPATLDSFDGWSSRRDPRHYCACCVRMHTQLAEPGQCEPFGQCEVDRLWKRVSVRDSASAARLLASCRQHDRHRAEPQTCDRSGPSHRLGPYQPGRAGRLRYDLPAR